MINIIDQRRERLCADILKVRYVNIHSVREFAFCLIGTSIILFNQQTSKLFNKNKLRAINTNQR